jgi:hypothetical protein
METTMRRIKLPIVTAVDGSATVYSPRVSGKIHSIQYVKTDFAAGVDFAVTAEATGENIWTESDVNASAVRYPRAATHTQAGAAALYASGGVGVLDKIAVANDRIKIVIAQGGNAKSGVVHVLVD